MLIRRWSAVLVLNALVASVSPAATQPDSGEPAQEQVALAQREMASAVEAMRANAAGWSDRVRCAAAGLSNVRRSEESIAALQELVDRCDKPFDLMEAWRMIGQDRLALGDLAGSQAAFGRAIAVIDANPRLERMRASFASALSQYAVVSAAQGDADTTIAANQRLLNPPQLDDNVRAGALANQSKYLASVGRLEDAAASVDQLLADHPRYIQNAGMEIALRLTRAHYRDPRHTGDVWIGELRRLWSDDRLREDPAILDVGAHLMQTSGVLGFQDESLQAAIDVVVLIEQKQTQWTNPEAPRRVDDEILRTEEKSALSRLSGAVGFGRPDLAYWALDRLATRAQSPQEQANYRRHRDSIDRKLLMDVQLLQERGNP